jgi:hypothetical protein
MPMDVLDAVRLTILSGRGLVALATAAVLFDEWRRRRGRGEGR